MKLIFNPLVNFGEVRRAQLAKPTLLAASGMFSDLLRSVQMLEREREREWGAENNGKLPHLSLPSKTATLGQNILIKIKLNPWHYSSEEPRST